MSGVVVAAVGAAGLLVVVAGYLLLRRRKNRQQPISPAPDGAIRMDVPDEEFWRWKPRRADDRQLPSRPRRGIRRRRVHSSS
jgi:LPXTG-motif cell wall-anchored protein